MLTFITQLLHPPSYPLPMVSQGHARAWQVGPGGQQDCLGEEYRQCVDGARANGMSNNDTTVMIPRVLESAMLYPCFNAFNKTAKDYAFRVSSSLGKQY